jgi:hypothetical protein
MQLSIIIIMHTPHGERVFFKLKPTAFCETGAKKNELVLLDQTTVTKSAVEAARFSNIQHINS